MGDSWYEYLLKVWVQGGRTKAMKGWHDMWEESMRAMIDKLVFDGEEAGTKYVAEFNANHAVHKMVSLFSFILLHMAIRMTSCSIYCLQRRAVKTAFATRRRARVTATRGGPGSGASPRASRATTARVSTTELAYATVLGVW